MKMNLMIAFTTVALASMSAAESYRVTLFQPSVVNGATLKPGDYKVEVKDNRATIKGGKESVETEVKVENTDSKYGATSVRYANDGGKFRVDEIRVGGTKTKLVFGATEGRPAGL